MEMRKGVSALVYILIPVVVSGLVILYAGMLPAALNSKLAENAFGTRTTSHARLLHSQVSGDYVHDAVNWSIYQATLDTDTVSWSSGSWPPSRSSFESRLSSQAEKVFRSYLSGKYTNSICSADYGELSVTVENAKASRGGTEGAVFDVEAGKPPSVTCESPKAATTIFISAPEKMFSAENTVFRLYDAAVSEIEDLQKAWSKVGESTSSGEACGSASNAESEARRNARGKVGDELSSKLDSAVGDSTSGGFSVSSSLGTFSVRISDVSSHPAGKCDCEQVNCETKTEKYNCETNDKGEKVNCDTRQVKVNCETVCHKKQYTASATASPLAADARLEVTGDASVPGMEGLETIDFKVDTYSHSFE
ncbi:MAG: hypothetical protein SVQ76_01210 [Candidatus Nanohaloarchaea archaeon]|nr:hypothetical protein [Candidatus Nanohaloarchaea archaeon]